MDYQGKSSDKKKSSIHWRRLNRFFLPIYILALIFPALILVATQFSRADQPNELIIWIEPQEIITSTAQKTEYTVYGNYQNTNKLISNLSFDIQGLTPDTLAHQIIYNKPFSGQLELGTFTLKPQQAGIFSLEINENTINLGGNQEVTIKTVPTKVVVKN